MSVPGGSLHRTDIDGLRLLALFLGIAFHLDVKWLPGGFVGVDMFYVISGYVITRNIVRDGDKFSFGRFFNRRWRRLMPSVWVTAAITMVVAFLVMTPDMARDAGWSAIAMTFAASNFVFWQEAGYWDTVAVFKPLLHTWSLGVEEQFYLVWPFMLTLARPLFGKWSLALFFGALIVGGTALAEWELSRDPAGAFYLMPFRIMEFATGAMVMVAEGRRFWPYPTWSRLLTCIAGLALIAWSGVAYVGHMRFPGIAGMVPSVGTALIIASGPQFIGRLVFENPVIAYLGRASYALYLTHWPLISFYKYLTLNPLDWQTQVGLTIATLITGLALHHLVERPFRVGGTFRPIYPVALTAVLAIALPAAAMARPNMRSALIGAPVSQQGWRGAVDLSFVQINAERRAGFCELFTPCGALAADKFNILVIGDSHAEDTYNALRVVFPDAHIVLASSPGCPAFVPAAHMLPLDATNADAVACRRLVTSVYRDRARLQQADLIVLSSFKSADQQRQVDTMLDYFSKLGPPILVFGNPPAYTAPLREIVRVRNLTPDQPVPAEFIDIAHADSVDAETRSLAEKYGAHFVPMRDYFCPHGRCTAWTPDRARLVSYDDHHLSRDAAEAFGRAREGPIRAAAVTR